MFNRYKVNQNRLNFLPSIFSLVVFSLFLAAVYWYFLPFNASEVKVLAVSEMVKKEQISGKFFGYLNYLEESTVNEQGESTPNPEITIKSFDSRVISNQTFYLSKECQNLAQKKCQIWVLDHRASEPRQFISNLSQFTPENSKENFEKADNFAKFAETQDNNWLNIIFKTNSKNQSLKNQKSSTSVGVDPEVPISSLGLLQINRQNPEQSQFEILTQDNPKYLTYFR